MKRSLSITSSALLVMSACALPARASLIGSSVNGSLTFTGDPTNYFDPNNNFVPPAGYLNASGTTVAVSGSAVEFGFDDGASLITADLVANQITLGDAIEVSGSTGGFQLTLVDAAFSGLPFAIVGGNLLPTDFSLVGDTLTLNYAGDDVVAGQVLTTIVGPTPVPELSTFSLTLSSVVVSFALFAFRGLRSSS